MKEGVRGFTIIEMFIGMSLLAAILGGILCAYIVVVRYFKDGVAMANCQAAARTVIEKMTIPIRHGSTFETSPDGNVLTVDMTGWAADKYGDEAKFTFFDDDGDEETLDDNGIIFNGNTISTNIVKISDEEGNPLDIFQELVANERVRINFGVRDEGVAGHFREVHVCTEMKLRN